MNRKTETTQHKRKGSQQQQQRQRHEGRKETEGTTQHNTTEQSRAGQKNRIVGCNGQRTKETMSSPIPPISLASFITSSVDPSPGLAELAADLERPQSARDHREEIELFFALPEDEQRRYLRSLLTFVDEVAPRCLDVPRPSRLHPVQCLNLFVKGPLPLLLLLSPLSGRLWCARCGSDNAQHNSRRGLFAFRTRFAPGHGRVCKAHGRQEDQEDRRRKGSHQPQVGRRRCLVCLSASLPFIASASLPSLCLTTQTPEPPRLDSPRRNPTNDARSKKVKKYKTLLVEVFEALSSGKSQKTCFCQLPLQDVCPLSLFGVSFTSSSLFLSLEDKNPQTPRDH